MVDFSLTKKNLIEYSRSEDNKQQSAVIGIMPSQDHLKIVLGRFSPNYSAKFKAARGITRGKCPKQEKTHQKTSSLALG